MVPPVVDAERIDQWLAIQISKDRYVPQGGGGESMDGGAEGTDGGERAAAGSSALVQPSGGVLEHRGGAAAKRCAGENEALASLSAVKLLSTYDIDGKGSLNEEESLLMMADLDEYHTPDVRHRIQLVPQRAPVAEASALPTNTAEPSRLLRLTDRRDAR